MAVAALTGEEQRLVEEVSAERLMEATEAIAQWVRLSGTPEEAQAFDWIEGQLREYGLETTRYSHPALVSWPESASLTVTDAGGTSSEVTCRTHAFAVPTPEGGLEGELVYVGRGTAEELRERASGVEILELQPGETITI